MQHNNLGLEVVDAKEGFSTEKTIKNNTNKRKATPHAKKNKKNKADHSTTEESWEETIEQTGQGNNISAPNPELNPNNPNPLLTLSTERFAQAHTFIDQCYLSLLMAIEENKKLQAQLSTVQSDNQMLREENKQLKNLLSASQQRSESSSQITPRMTLGFIQPQAVSPRAASQETDLTELAVKLNKKFSQNNL